MSKSVVPVAELRQIADLVRAGLPTDHEHELDPTLGPSTLQAMLVDRFKAVKWITEQPVDDPRFYIGVLQFKALEAEFEYTFGDSDGRAVYRLREFLEQPPRPLPQSSALLTRLRERTRYPFVLQRAPEDLSLDDRRRFARQQVWALMAYAFYYVFERERHASKALSQLNAIETVVNNELVDDVYRANGTIARLHAFRAQCHRSLRSFAEAQREFMESQRYAERRLADKIRRHDPQKHSDLARKQEEQLKRQQAYRFSVIVTARALGGVGRIAVLKGELRRAEMLFRAARTLLRPTGHIVLKNVVASHLAIAQRRLANAGSDDWVLAIERLTTLYRRFTGDVRESRGKKEKRPRRSETASTARPPAFIDRDGARRAAQELASAYLDKAELSPKTKRIRALRYAGVWISRLERLAASENSIERFRAHLLRVRLEVLRPKPDVREAARHVRRAQGQRFKRYREDVAGFDMVDIDLANCIIAAAKYQESGSSNTKRRMRLESVTRPFYELIQGAERQHDQLLHAETILRLGLVFTIAHRPCPHLRTWKNSYAGTIENMFLQGLYSSLINADGFVHEGPTASAESFVVHAERNEIDAIRIAMAKHGNNKTRAADELGMKRNTLLRRITKYKLSF
jgi:hypothetical protein